MVWWCGVVIQIEPTQSPGTRTSTVINSLRGIIHKNQGLVTLETSLKMFPCIKQITIKYYHSWIFFERGQIIIKHIYTKEQVMNILTKHLDAKLFIYLNFNILNVGRKRYPFGDSLKIHAWSGHLKRNWMGEG